MKTATLRNGSRLAGVVWPFVMVAVVQAVIAIVSLHALSSVRAYVGGESLWSKGQKDAIFYLHLYAENGHDQYYRKYAAAIAIPLADRQARLALDRSEPDRARAREGFAAGRNHIDDIPGLIWLFVNFRSISYLEKAVIVWERADPMIVELDQLAQSIRASRAEILPGPRQVQSWKEQIFLLNDRITPLAKAFSDALGEGSRAIKNILLGVNLFTAALLILLAIWRTRRLLNQRLAFETALTAERERAEITLGSIGQAVVSTDIAGRVDYMNSAAERLLAVQLADARGRPIEDLFSLADEHGQADTANVVGRTLAGAATGETFHSQRLFRLNGTSVPVSVVGTPLIVSRRKCGVVLVFYDLTAEREYTDRLAWQASHDELTGLANRRAFEERLETALSLVGSGQQHALMLLDLDQFKIINDTGGHAAGDSLLKRVAAALQKELRPGDLLARFGGDEFGILLSGCAAAEAAELAERLRTAVQHVCFAWKDRPFNTSVSIGLVPIAQEGLTVQEALQAADVACYMAKDKGRNRVQIHHSSDSEVLQRFAEMAWVQKLHLALEQDRFRLQFQEIVPLKDAGAGRHIELLLRLMDEQGRMVPPGSFIPAAERYGLMPLIDRWVVKTAFAVLASAGGSAAGITTCAINLSGITFNDDSFVGFVEEQFRLHGIETSTICFEITETSAIADLPSATRLIGALQKLGCRFSLDDFGAGMSSFAYLKHLPVDYLKIDGSFVKDMLDDRIDRAMVEMINHIGHVTGKKTIAEFVETPEIAAALREIGVDYAQGFGISASGAFDAAALAATGRPFRAGADAADGGQDAHHWMATPVRMHA
jgi:diguanylate cyclase (GGDEF)-like protein/PAS domain S-box-containing protein